MVCLYTVLSYTTLRDTTSVMRGSAPDNTSGRYACVPARMQFCRPGRAPPETLWGIWISMNKVYECTDLRRGRDDFGHAVRSVNVVSAWLSRFAASVTGTL